MPSSDGAGISDSEFIENISENARAIKVAISDELGTVKVIRIPSGHRWDDAKVINKWGKESRENGISFFSFNKPPEDVSDSGASEESSRGCYCIARKNGKVEIRDMAFSELGNTVPSESKANVKRIFAKPDWKDNRISRIVSVEENGTIAMHKIEESEKEASDRMKEILNFRAINGNITTAAMDARFEKIVFGGDGTPLSVFDIDTQKIMFISKPRKDPYKRYKRNWITACTFTQQDRMKESNLLFCGTAESELCLYDIRRNTRPISTIKKWKDSRVTVIKPENSEKIWVGNGEGFVECYEVRNRLMRGGLKGQIAGSIRGLDILGESDDANPNMIASAGLDRFLRIHQIERRQIKLKFYCKYQMTGVAFIPLTPQDIVDENLEDRGKRKILAAEDDEEEERKPRKRTC